MVGAPLRNQHGECLKVYSEGGDRRIPDEYDAVILGAGISGLVSASILLEQGARKIALVDEFDHIGGNHIDCSHGDYTFDVGSFIFQDDSPLLRHFPELMQRYVPIQPSWGKLTPQGIVTTYPISVKVDIAAAGPLEWIRMLASLAYARLFQRCPTNAKEFARYWIGSYFLWRSGLEHYMERFFGISGEKVDIKFARKRMLWISEHARARVFFSRLVRKVQPQPGNSQLARPREGFAYLYELAAERLEKNGVTLMLGVKMRSLTRNGESFHLSLDDRTIAGLRVISTIPLERAQALCNMPSREALDTVTLISLFYSFSGDRGFDYSILYNFSFNGAWKRITMYSDFYGKSNGRDFFTVEVIASQVGNSMAAADLDFREHVGQNPIFIGDLQLEGSRLVENAYPIYTDRSGERAEKVIGALKAFGVESFGRQGGFEYQPTARVSTIEAETALAPT